MKQLTTILFILLFLPIEGVLQEDSIKALTISLKLDSNFQISSMLITDSFPPIFNSYDTGILPLLESDNCGSWKFAYSKDTNWYPIDTLGEVKDEVRNWIKKVDTIDYGVNSTTLEYNPCGKDPSSYKEYWRVCSITGIIQVREVTHIYEYIPPGESAYNKIIKSFKNQKSDKNDN